jgi:hypothetical protein
VLDDAFGQDPSFEFEAAYEEPYADFRMHFVTWDLPDAGLHRCFEMLPRGAEMCNRAIEMRSLYRAKKSAISEREALELFQRGLGGFAQFVASEDLKKPVRVVRGTSAELNVIHADRVAVLLEGIDWNVRFDEETLEVKPFLSETLYRLAYSYDVADYVTWPLFPDPQAIDPYRGFALLAFSDVYFPLLDADGPVLFIATDRLPR